jgi:hypothetical protein
MMQIPKQVLSFVFTNSFYAWRKIEGMIKEVDGIDAIHPTECSIKDCVILFRTLIYLPDSFKKNERSFVAILSIAATKLLKT